MTNKNLFTHGGLFHADEVFSTIILCNIFEKSFSEVNRIFQIPDEVSDSDIIYDIGGGKYDHHQKGGNGSRENDIPYASAGLIWRDYGRYFLSKEAPDFSKESIQKLWKTVDERFVQPIDAIDNGIEMGEAYSVASIIDSYNPLWNEEEDADQAFVKACKMMEEIFYRFLKRGISTLEAEEIVAEAYKNAEDRIMVLPQFAPWQNCLLELDEKEEILFVVFPSSRGGYMVQTVPVTPGSFEFRQGLKT